MTAVQMMWFIQEPRKKGRLSHVLPETAAASKRDAVWTFCGDSPGSLAWKNWRADGYRAVKCLVKWSPE